jgi:UDP-2,4-diacetamido-2,4,6-trideoxy-beta-L-altropyranose hydrolase
VPPPLKNTPLVIRADGGLQDGIGHVMRCLALARGWQAAGGRVVFLAHCEGEVVPKWIRDSGSEYVPLPAPHPDPGDLQFTLSHLRRAQSGASGDLPTWLVMDGYHFDAGFDLAIRAAGFPVLTIDDHAHRYALHGDAVLNQGLGAQDFYYRAAPDALMMLGPRYALLRPEFLEWRDWHRPIRRQVRKVLVTLGGTDADNVTEFAIETMRHLDREGLEVRIVVGPTSPHVRSLLRAVRDTLGRFRLLTSVTDMPRLMAWADFAISAGGITSWELAYMGVPSAILIIARNQIRNAETVEAAGAGINGGWRHQTDARSLAGRMEPLLRSRSIRARMSRCGRRLIDGKGVDRVVARLGLTVQAGS